MPSLADLGSSALTAGISAPVAPVGGFSDSLSALTRSVVGIAQSYYGTQALVEQAKANAAIAKAQGQNAVQVAQAGTPSTGLLLLGGGALLGLFLIMDKRK